MVLGIMNKVYYLQHYVCIFSFNDSPSLQVDFQMDFEIKIWHHSSMIYRATMLVSVQILSQAEEYTALDGFQLLQYCLLRVEFCPMSISDE